MREQERAMGRKKKGLVLITVGTCLILAAFALTGYNYWDSVRAGREASEVLEELEEKIPETSEEDDADDAVKGGVQTMSTALKPDADMEMPVIKIKGHTYIGTLKIPSLNLKLPIMSEWNYPNLRIAPCRYRGSAYKSNLIIAAHNYDTHFGRIKTLAVGDTVIFTDADGNRFNYHVADMEILQPTSVEQMRSGDWDLTLFTCTIGGRTRVTVRCTSDMDED
jgi:sortase A